MSGSSSGASTPWAPDSSCTTTSVTIVTARPFHSSPVTTPRVEASTIHRAIHAAGRASTAAAAYQAAKHGTSHNSARSANRQTRLDGDGAIGRDRRGGARQRTQPQEPDHDHVEHDERLPRVQV